MLDVKYFDIILIRNRRGSLDWKNATISNNFMFRLVMEKQELCKLIRLYI